MQRWYRIVVVALVSAIVLGCQSIQTQSDYDPSASFVDYRTFSWVSDKPLLAAPPGTSPLAEGRVQRAISDTLVGKGYRYVRDRETADFVIGFTLGARDKVRLDSITYPVGFRGPYGWGAAYYQTVDVSQYTEGRLAVDMFDVQSRRPVWHGFAIKNLNGADERDPEKTIRSAVSAILGKFPPQPGR